MVGNCVSQDTRIAVLVSSGSTNMSLTCITRQFIAKVYRYFIEYFQRSKRKGELANMQLCISVEFKRSNCTKYVQKIVTTLPGQVSSPSFDVPEKYFCKRV